MIDPSALLAHRIPSTVQHLTTRDTILYALGIGLGADPLDGRQLDYVDHHRPLKPMPAIALVLAHPGFWLADTGVDAVRLVHGEQWIEWHAPLPAEGEITGHTIVTGLVDKGPGRGALLFTEKRLTQAGTLLATTGATVFLRGDGGCGGPTGPIPPPHPCPSRRPTPRSTCPPAPSRPCCIG